ncbi:MAG: hypothetical protein H6712_02960 [Myxococcales bacterium]|nr:hypothetical protein [Myxococcales bacterium]MCB9712786.1 hypothetical protein [Myxococcales bacterium]
MPRLPPLLLALVLAGLGCNDRTVGDEPPMPDIEGLCQTYCERVFQCGDVGSGPIQTVEACVESCMTVREWDIASCVEPYEAYFTCVNQYECPEFTNSVICNDENQPDTQCCPESEARQRCRYQ